MSEVLARAGRAQAELTETQAAFEALRKSMSQKLFSTAFSDVEQRERLYHAVQVLDAVRQGLIGVVEAGQLEVAAAEMANRIATGATT